MLFCGCLQREAAIECAHDPMSPNSNKQTTVAVNYLLTEYVIS